ncbi:hypothetical protein GF362_03415 [Candidatus Dojkabacteria bacterium]|nr:hypothetical protein [Candidatus Dojkabacteria bacterium]
MNYHFLLCSERSGSNFTTKLFNAHPAICGPSPSHVIRAFAQNINNYGSIKKSKNWNILISDIHDYLNFQLGTWKTKVSKEELLQNISEKKLSSIIKYVYKKEAKANSKENLFIKENRLYNYISYILCAFPEASFIYVVRDPRDVVLSFKKSHNNPFGVIRATEIWKSDQLNSIQQYGYLKDEQRILMIKYEDLVSNTENELKDACKFLGHKYSDKMLEFYKDDITQKNAEKMKEWSNLSKPVIKNNFNKYRKELKDYEIQYIEYNCKKEMGFLGYELEYPEQRYNIDRITTKLKKEGKKLKDKQNEVSKEERELREKRLKIIDRILNRNLK